jgi:alpha-L-rhamnosidase
VCDAINARFLDRSTMEYAGGIGAANAFALALNAVAAADRPPVRAALVRRYRATGALDTGIFGTPLLLDALSAAGATDLALALVRGPGFPSYGYMLEHGATTLWEHWDGRESHNHPMFGSVSEWFTERLAGLRCVRVARASDHVVVEPFAQDALGAAAMTYEGTRGRYQLAWTQQEGRRQLHLELPPGVIATVRCPGSVPWRARAGVFDLEWDRARDGDAVPARLAERLGWTPLGPPRS